MKNVQKMMDRAVICTKSRVHCAAESFQDFLKSEDGLTVVEIVLLIAVVIIAVGLLSGYMQGAIKQIFSSLNKFIGNASSVPTDLKDLPT